MRLRFTSPVSMLDDQSSSGCTSTLLSSDFLKSSTGSSTVYFTFIILRALSTAFSDSPTTIATASPTLLTWRSRINLSYGDGSGKVWPAIEKRFFGTSSQVYTATMPGTLRAISVFTSSTIAFAYGLLRSFMTSASRGVISSVNTGFPSKSWLESFFGIHFPTAW